MNKLDEIRLEIIKLTRLLTCRITVTESSIIADPKEAYELAHLKHREFFEYLRGIGREKD